jgi:CheY-like chemotaxis protein
MADPISKRVLIVDDNADAADLLAILLRTAGHHVEVAYSGPSAVAVALTQKPHVIFLDIAMPKMDGLKVARQLRGKPETKAALIVAVPGLGGTTTASVLSRPALIFTWLSPFNPNRFLSC